MAPGNANLAFQARLASLAACRSVPDDTLELVEAQNTTSLFFVLKIVPQTKIANFAQPNKPMSLIWKNTLINMTMFMRWQIVTWIELRLGIVATLGELVRMLVLQAHMRSSRVDKVSTFSE